MLAHMLVLMLYGSASVYVLEGSMSGEVLTEISPCIVQTGDWIYSFFFKCF